MGKYINSSVVPKGNQELYLKPYIVDYLGLDKSEDSPVYISLKYYDSGFECFSDWTSQELKSFSDLIKKLSKTTWDRIKRGTGGLGCKVHKERKHLPKREILKSISPESTLVEMRVNGTARIHGFIVKSSFFLVWLDREHKVYKD